MDYQATLARIAALGDEARRSAGLAVEADQRHDKNQVSTMIHEILALEHQPWDMHLQQMDKLTVDTGSDPLHTGSHLFIADD